MPRNTEGGLEGKKPKVGTTTSKEEEEKIDKKIAKLENKMAGTRSKLERIENKLQKQRLMKNKRLNEKLQIRKNAKRVERERFIRNFAFRNDAITMYSPLVRPIGHLFPKEDDDDMISSLPSDMIAAIAYYLGPIELTSLLSVSHVIEKKLATSFSTLYTSLVVSMTSFIRKENELTFALSTSQLSNVVFNILPKELSIVKKVTVIRFLLHMLYLFYANHRYSLTMSNRYGNRVHVTPSLTFYENWSVSSSSQCRFLPLTNGMFLATSIKSNLSTMKDTIMERDEFYRHFLRDTMGELMDYDDCCNMKLVNLSKFRHDDPLGGDIAAWRIVHFDHEGTLTNVNIPSLYEIHCFPSHCSKLRLLDMSEVRFSKKIGALSSTVQDPDIMYCLDVLEGVGERQQEKFYEIISKYVAL